ncbi:PilZ domain-containing protein [Leisingera sp. JC11]|uniref:PilZ domain-containing protein n=1 Tax=Leisingera sp. JC11 TaxID=3042469 RepID=UPI003451BBB0
MFRQPEPSEPRLSLKLPCTLNLPVRDLAATTVNVSYGGLGIELPEGAPVFDRKELLTVTVDGIGVLQVDILWWRGSRLGLKFRSKRSARPALDAYFRKLGEYPT